MGLNEALGEARDYGPSVDWWGLGVLTSDILTGLEPILIASAETSAGRRVLTDALKNGPKASRRPHHGPYRSRTPVKGFPWTPSSSLAPPGTPPTILWQGRI